MSSRYKIISSETVIHTPWRDFKKDEFETGAGERGEYYYMEQPANIVITVPVLTDGRLVLVSQHRYLQDKISIEFPRGRIQDDEAPLACAQRELLEETGYASDDFVKIGVFEGFNIAIKSPTHLFVADSLIPAAEAKDANEEIEVFFRRMDEFDDMVKRGEIWDGQTLAAWALTRDYVRNLFNPKE